MKELKDPKEIKETLNSTEPVAIFFFSSMCGHCQVMHKPWNELENEKKDVKFVKIESQNIPSELGISGVPEFRLIRNGKQVKKVGGEQPKEKLKSALFGTGGGKRRRSLRLRSRARKTRHRTARRKVAF
jgi:thioredoxin-like negative regulator of GroEL